MGLELKPIRWLGTTRDDIREHRPAIRYELGQQLLRVQMGDLDLARKRYREARNG
jgi:phage-related protein